MSIVLSPQQALRLLSDVALAALDPRIRLEGGTRR